MNLETQECELKYDKIHKGLNWYSFIQPTQTLKQIQLLISPCNLKQEFSQPVPKTALSELSVFKPRVI